MIMKTFICHARFLGVYHRAQLDADNEESAWQRFLNLIKSGQTQTFKEDVYRKDRLYLFIEELINASGQHGVVRSKD